MRLYKHEINEMLANGCSKNSACKYAEGLLRAGLIGLRQFNKLLDIVAKF